MSYISEFHINMTFRKIPPQFFVLIFNLWLIKIFNFNMFFGTVVVLASVFIYLSIQTGIKRHFYFSAFFISALMIFQYKTSSINPLTF